MALNIRAGLALCAVALVGVGSVGCEAGGIGDPCIPEDEYRADFAGYAKEEVNVESRSFQCETRICLVNNFQGRVSCPFGQDEAQAKGENGQAPGCLLPDFSGPVRVPVVAQMEKRPPTDSVYCSCRCKGIKGSKAPNCECPSGFSCEALVDDLDLGKKELVGSYCVKEGTHFEDPVDIRGDDCTPDNASCKGREDF